MPAAKALCLSASTGVWTTRSPAGYCARLFPFFRSAFGRTGRGANPPFDQLLVAARAQIDEAKRKQLYADMQVLVHEQCGVGIPVFKSAVEAYSTELKGYGATPVGAFMGFAFAEQVWLEA